MSQEFLNIKEVAAILKVHPATVNRYCNAGSLSYYKIGSRKRFKKEDIDKYLEGGRCDATGADSSKNPFNAS